MYAVPQVNGKPCPKGWTASWQSWAQGPVCETIVNYNPNTGQYPQSYRETKAQGTIYEKRAALGSSPTATPKKGQALIAQGKSWVVTNTQVVTFTGTKASLTPSGQQMLDRLLAALQADESASVSLSSLGADTAARTAATRKATAFLTANGIDPSRIKTRAGGPGASRIEAAILHPLGQGVRVTPVSSR